jgi:hypothetical protein
MEDAMGDEFLQYADDEAYIVRRLGTAFVSLWPEIPEEVREQIVRKSLVVVDAYDAAQLEEKIRDFIAKHAGER